VETITNTKAKGLNFVHLPGFAKYLLSEKLEEFVFLYRQIMIESDFPLLKLLNGITDIEQQIVALHLITNLLTNLSQNNAPRQIQEILSNWQNNQLPFLDKYEITTGDITRFSYTRKKTFLHFLPAYCSDSATMLELIEEIDRFLMHYDLAASETYINLLQSRINDHSHLINKVNNTLPGAVYIFDLNESKNIYANEKLDRIIGYTRDELNETGINALANFIHPEDGDTIKKHYTDIEKASDGDILSYRFRVRQKDGSYKWIRNFEAVFKRDENGKASQLICISLDVHREKKTAEQLKQREEQLLEAQEIAQLGSFSWDLRGNASEASPELSKILEIPANEFNNFIEHVHPEDKAYVEKAFAEALKTGMYECEYRYRGKEKEKFIWSRGKVIYEKDLPVMITGTVMDITDRQLLLQKAQENERLYQEAEAISNIGNVNWDLASGEITWSDELYRIFEIDPAKEKITLEKFESRVHPDDRNKVMLDISEALKNKKSYNHLYRIWVRNGRIKNIHGRGEVILDKKGESIKVIGTAQDVTERQKMIEQLQESEKLFKQAQSMAQMGNWSLNIDTNEVKWSDEMFRIYGLAEAEPVTAEKLFAMVHPDDYGKLIEKFEACRKERSPFDMIHRIVLPSGQTKTLHQKAEFIFNQQTNSKLMVGTTQDVTDQFAVQQELKEKENFIRKIADATPSIISSYNINTGKYVFVSEGIQKLLSYDPDEALEGGIPFFNSIIHPDDLAGVIEKNTKALEEANKKDTGKENIVEFIYRLKHSKGHYRWFHTYGTVFDRNKSGKVEHLLNISLDVTESIEATKKIEEQV
jgi:PAS domain S-box-containing protein